MSASKKQKTAKARCAIVTTTIYVCDYTSVLVVAFGVWMKCRDFHLTQIHTSLIIVCAVYPFAHRCQKPYMPT